MIKLGIICPSEIAFRRFLPALTKNKNFQYIGVAVASEDEWFGENKVSEKIAKDILDKEFIKAQNFKNFYGGKIYRSYKSLIKSEEIDAIYLPLPPALHYKWAKKALNNNIHVFVEKPSTTSYRKTSELIEIAKKKNLAIHENYMFIYHSQIATFSKIINSGEIGNINLCRIDFGFPDRGVSDFRYNKKLGGGALLDCGGYTLKYANYILGGDAQIQCANSIINQDRDVDIFGSATLKNNNGKVVQVAFGMDNDYRCNLEAWGSKGTLKTGRVLTAPADYQPQYEIIINGRSKIYKLDSDDAFYKSIQKFYRCINDTSEQINHYNDLLTQEKLVSDFARLANLDLGEEEE